MKMAISYTEALAILEIAAREIGGTFCREPEVVPILEATGRIASADVHSPTQTPAADSSAMDGYAIASENTLGASVERPTVFRVEGIIAAGDRNIRRFRDDDGVKDAWANRGMDAGHADLELTSDGGYATLSGVTDAPCIEIMTGARFPPPFVEGGKEWVFDSCVRLEDVTPLPPVTLQGVRLIQTVKPVPLNLHRRRAGEDFAKGDLVVRKGQTLRPQHIMALASLGMHEIQVFRTLSVAILSSGEEVVSHYAPAEDHLVRDANGPFLETSLRSLGASVQLWGIVGDNCDQFVAVVKERLLAEKIDVLISTGAVSVGRYDFIEAAFAELEGEARFHHVSVRPGHPILFGVIPRGGNPMHNELRDDFKHSKNQRAVAFFGLPGNPMACVACLRFFVIPYIRFLHNLPPESPTPCRVWSQDSLHENGNMPVGSHELLSPPSHLTMFRLGVRLHDTGAGRVVLVPAQGSHKIQPLLHADCWVIFPGTRVETRGGAVLDTLPLYPTSFGIG